ncbi:hypothetical protein [Ktedonosporobacter rubrisoli]|uniref:hypothetical protein n=1 Tax=Ktedonosporobacter rubrisoli TaxID=2509675 RepID=UPI0013EEC163|nr:hypothetical protein [Ktedonosporobacter rubrisoli]
MIGIKARKIIAIGLSSDPGLKISRTIEHNGAVHETRTSTGPQAEEESGQG